MTIRYSLSLALVLAATMAVGVEPAPRNTPKKPALDVGKYRVEAPTKYLVKRTAPDAKFKSSDVRAEARAEVEAKVRPLANKQRPKGPFPVSKSLIEAPAKAIVKSSARASVLEKSDKASKRAGVAAVDQPKRVVELPTKRIVQVASPASAKPQAVESDNPRVSPGKVRWAGDYAEALAASKKSGKPVLLFQLLGQLDHKFT